MRSRITRRCGLPFAAVLALAATAPGTAVASFGTLSYPVRGPVSAPVDGERAFAASCPAATHVLGGGQYVFAADRDAIVHSSAPFDGPDADNVPDDGWRSRVDSFNGAQNTVTEYAICTTKEPAYRAKAVTVHAPAQPKLRTSCPTGDAVVGGGVDISAKYASAYVTVSDPGPGASWDGHAVAGLAGAANQRVTDSAICAPATLTYRSVSGVVADHSFGEASAPCPARTSVVGGGVRTPDVGMSNFDVDMRPTIFSPFDGSDGDFVPDDGWRVEADDWGATGTLMVQSTAVCLH
jgi:hypothetical protein